MKQKSKQLSFEDTEIAFRGRSDKELRRSYWLFRILSVNLLTAVGPPLTNFALAIRLPVKGIIRNTVFKHFCGGESIEQCNNSIKELASRNVGTILDYSREGENSEIAFNAACVEILSTVEYARNNPHIPFSVFKPTALGRFFIFEKFSRSESLTDDEADEFERICYRMDRICKACYESNVKVLIDAEHSWIQNTIDHLVAENMQKYNRETAIVFNTYQLYRHDKLGTLMSDFQRAAKGGYFLGAKLVRGAYMEIERSRAITKNYSSPVHVSKEATDECYDKGISFCLNQLDRISLMAGTHNERSCQFLASEMVARDIPANSAHVYFAQLYGMGDNLSFNLADGGYNVAKYMPYGSIAVVMPYLFRRARENTSVAGQVGRELSLIIKEMKRRKECRL